jgi:AcrR family transcriptional regulator
VTEPKRYHHGHLAEAMLDAALAAITESGAEFLSMRDLARRAGVSHAAPRHHFGDKAGLLTVIATQGFAMLADALESAQQDVRFAQEHRAHFEVMFRPHLYRGDAPEVQAESQRAAEALYRGADSLPDGQRGSDVQLDGIAAWSLVHGFSTLWLNGVLPPWLGEDSEAAARSVARILFGLRQA